MHCSTLCSLTFALGSQRNIFDTGTASEWRCYTKAKLIYEKVYCSTKHAVKYLYFFNKISQQYLLGKIFANAPFLSHQHVHSAFNQKLCSTWYLVVIGTSRMTDILSVTTLSFFLFSSLHQISVYADLPSFMSPSLITGDSLRPDLLLLTGNKVLYILELTPGFETNIQANSVRKAYKYTPILHDLSSYYNRVSFINVSMGALGVMGASCDSILSLLQDLSFDKVTQRRIIMKTINIAIRSTYYIFCQRNKPWNNYEFLNF